MGLGNTVWDSSGYSNNGICSHTLSYNTNSAEGSYSLQLNSDIQLENAHNLRTIFNTSSFTICMWINLTTTSTGLKPIMYMGEAQGSKCVQLGIDFNNNGVLYFGFYDNDIVKTDYSISSNLNKWILLSCVYNKEERIQKIYVNGNFENQRTPETSPSIETNLFTIKNNISGLIDDFRIYCTPLDNTTISNMYKVKASVDKYGNLYSSEFVENTTDLTNINVNRKYTFESSGFNEQNSKVTMNSTDKTVYVNELIEI